jgi:hypothetical protein
MKFIIKEKKLKTLNITQRKQIINLVTEIQKIIKLDSMNIDYEYGSRFVVSTSSTNNHHIIELYDKTEFSKGDKSELMDNKHFGLSDYFNDMKISLELHYSAYYLFSTLHEFGHVDQCTLFKNPFQATMISNATGLMLSGTKPKLNSVIRYHNLYNELYADKFAYRWFPIIWIKFNKEIIEILK